MSLAKTILVVDDEKPIVDVIRAYLENDGFTVVSAYNGLTALQAFNRHAPDLVVLDLMLPDISGENVCAEIRKKSLVPIIMLTAKSAEDDLIGGLSLGADDYVTKPFSPRQLLARIHAILRRVNGEPVPPASQFSFNQDDLVIDNLRHEVRRNGQPVALTPNEFKLLTVMAKYPAKVFTRDELITYAMSDDYQGNDRVIDSHIKNIRQKIETDPRNPLYILTVHGIGYKFGGNQ